MIGRRGDAQAFDDAWNQRTPGDREIAELVRVAEALCEAAAEVSPTPEFTGALRTRLMAEAATTLIPVAKPTRTVVPISTAAPKTPTPTRRRAARLSAAGFAVAGVVGLVSTSAQAVPGDMLYPVKRSVENVELVLHRSDAARGEFQLAQASERLAEAAHLAQDGSPASQTRIVETLADFADQAGNGSAALFNDYDRNGSDSSVQIVSDFTATATTRLAELSTVLPPAASGTFGRAAETVENLATQAKTLCQACVDADVSALAAAVQGLTSTTPQARPSGSDDGSTGSATQPTTVSPTPPSGTAGATPKPTAAAPKPSPTPHGLLTPLTDPLLGGLLGNDEQQGLVPGLLNGLLGGGKK